MRTKSLSLLEFQEMELEVVLLTIFPAIVLPLLYSHYQESAMFQHDLNLSQKH
jgi:hypothetical protein